MYFPSFFYFYQWIISYSQLDCESRPPTILMMLQISTFPFSHLITSNEMIFCGQLMLYSMLWLNSVIYRPNRFQGQMLFKLHRLIKFRSLKFADQIWRGWSILVAAPATLMKKSHMLLITMTYPFLTTAS